MYVKVLKYRVLLSTNTHLFHKLSHSYFRFYRVIFRGLVIRTLPSYTSNSDVRHPSCISLYNGKDLRVEYTQSNTIISILNIMRVLTNTCFGLTCGPSSGCKIRLDKLYYNAWETFCEKGAGVLGYHGPGTPQQPLPLLSKCFPCIIV